MGRVFFHLCGVMAIVLAVLIFISLVVGIGLTGGVAQTARAAIGETVIVKPRCFEPK